MKLIPAYSLARRQRLSTERCPIGYLRESTSTGPHVLHGTIPDVISLPRVTQFYRVAQ